MINGHLCCALDGHWAEEAHFLKNDLLTVQVVNLIYRSFQRANVELPTVTELLERCNEDKSPWKLYENGCTLCLNQVEKPGTSARVGQYKPKNISELCAFVAAIRPGFKSMYKTFESRVPFKYGVKAFDDLIQTAEMPNSFVLYQEMEMAALHYAGIPMADTYTAVKNIAKKRAEKVLAYKETFINGFKEAIVRDEHRTQNEAEELAEKLWTIIEDSARYSFNASHSYCVALDSLYGAWIKSHYPVEFYETALRIYEKKGNKDKMSALKDEAERYFKIHFPPFRYGQDNRSINGNPKELTIVNSMRSIKGFGESVGNALWEGYQELGDFASFSDVLLWYDKHGIKSSKLVPLIQIDYFIQFGNSAELLRIVKMLDFFKWGEIKTIKKENISPDIAPLIKDFVSDVGKSGKPLKTYTVLDAYGLIKKFESEIFKLNIADLSYKMKASLQQDILGYVDLTTGKEEDRLKLYVLDVYALKNRFRESSTPWKYKVKCKSIGNGKINSLDVSPLIMKNSPIKPGDIIQANNFAKDKKGYWNLVSYQIIPA